MATHIPSQDNSSRKLLDGGKDDESPCTTSLLRCSSVSVPEQRAAAFLFLAALTTISWYKWEDLTIAAAYESSPVDWCEANYEKHSHVSEFWNTISSCFMALVGMVGPFFFSCDRMNAAESKLHLLWLLMIFVGFGSVLFHSTLSVVGQVLDELPIVALILYSIASFRPRRRWSSPTFRAILFNEYFLLCLMSGATLLCVLHPLVCHVITCAMLPGGTYLYLREYRAAIKEQDKYTKRAKALTTRIFALALLNFAGALSMWVIDRLYCTELTEFFVPLVGGYPQLHAWWHVLMTNCFWGCVCTGLANRLAGEHRTVDIGYDRVTGRIPFVRLL